MSRRLLTFAAVGILQTVTLAHAQTRVISEPIAVVQAGGKWSVSNGEMALIGGWGFINAKGVYVFPQQFEGADRFSEGLAAVRIGGKWGFIDATGETVISPRFDHAGTFSGGLANVTVEGKGGFIDKSGAMAFDGSFDHVWPFSCGRALVEVDHKRGYIDRAGKMVIDPQYDMAMPFSEGLAHVERNGTKALIDTAGKVVASFPIEPSGGGCTEGLCAVKIGEKWGFIDTTGKIVIAPRFAFAINFSEGLAQVSSGDQRYFFIDKTGKTVISPRIGHGLGCEGFKFSEGLTAVWIEKSRRCGFIDRKNRLVARTQFEQLTLFDQFSGGLAGFTTIDGKRGFVNRAGKIVIPPRFDYVIEFFLPDRSPSLKTCRVQ